MRFSTENAAGYGARGGLASTPAKRRAARANGRKRRKPHALFSSRTEEWATPPALFAALAAEFGGFDLDPCATPANATCPTFYTREDDGLVKPWSGRVFMNPPYGRPIGLWVAKAWEEAQRGALVVALLPSRTDTTWWHDYVLRGEVRPVRGRLHFGGSATPAPFPSAVVVFRPPHGATSAPFRKP